MELKPLSKKIPSRTKTVFFKWAYKNWMQCTAQYRAIRDRGNGSMQKCDWCGHKFQDDEWFGLAQTMPGSEGPKRNWALCNDCADKIGAKDAPNLKFS